MTDRQPSLRTVYLLHWADRQDEAADAIARAAQRLWEAGDEPSARAVLQECHSLRVAALEARAQAATGD